MVRMKDIRAAARRIGEQFRPEKVILFGSYAYGRPTADSDVDLLVIMPVKGPPEYKAVEIHMAVDIRFPTDLLVRTPQEIRRRVRWGDFFIREILDKGKVLYESPDRGMGRKSRSGLRKPTARTAVAHASES